MRSGISIAKQQANRQVISPSEIMRLNDLESYVRLPGGFPITKVPLTYKHRDNMAGPFIARKIDERNFNEINSLIESAENAVPPGGLNKAMAQEENALQW
jgi:type IV secretory pathway TraG/TraD family ATPase VirD4